jgi:hypothetical protein
MAKSSQLKWLENLTARERLDAAKALTRKVVGHATHLLALHESNRQLVFSDVVAKQVTRSHAANTFNLLRDSQFRYEVIRLCALWDPPSPERESISTIAALVNAPTVIELVAAEARVSRLDMPRHILGCPSAEERAVIEQYSQQRAAEEAEEWAIGHCRQVRRACWNARRVMASVKLRAMQDFRNHHLAHSLAEGARRAVPDVSPRYGDERRLLNISMKTLDRFYGGLYSTNFIWDDTRQMFQRDAELFWRGVKIEVIG